MISLAGKAALITGGSRGIGAAAVKLFAQAGADVVFSYNKAADAAKQIEQEAGKHGTRVEAFKADVGKHADNKKLVEHCIARLGRLDIVVANAGVWNIEDLPIEKMTEKQWDEMMRVNLKSVYSIIHFSVPQMIKQKGGKIIPITSTAGQRGESLHTHYGASKGGVISEAVMQVSLLERVEKLGQIGDEVRVKDGFARNYLLPKKKALRATDKNRAFFETQRTQLEARNLERKGEAEKIAKKLDGKTFVLLRQAGDRGQLYGSVSPRDIADVVTAGGFHVDRTQVPRDKAIKEIGLVQT